MLIDSWMSANHFPPRSIISKRVNIQLNALGIARLYWIFSWLNIKKDFTFCIVFIIRFSQTSWRSIVRTQSIKKDSRLAYFLTWQLIHHHWYFEINSYVNTMKWNMISHAFVIVFADSIMKISSNGSFSRVTGPCARYDTVTGEFPSQIASNVDFDISLLWVCISC